MVTIKKFPHKESEARNQKICYKMSDGSFVKFHYFSKDKSTRIVTVHNGGSMVDKFIKNYGYTEKPFSHTGIRKDQVWEISK